MTQHRPGLLADRAALAAGALLLWLPIGMGFWCKPNDVEYLRFNGNDVIQVEVTAGDTVGVPVTIDLTSSSGAIVVGTATVDPGSGPVGTRHEVSVQVANAYEEIVERVTLEVDSGQRGLAEFELSQDSADHGYWWLELESVGEPGETRTDSFTIVLWEVDLEGEGDDTGSDDTGDDTADDTDTGDSDTSDTSDTGT